ncbi:L-dopachrome tautomerase-related protein [Massilia sp. METH4]|uniref:L-dopachrome tautomerase-related protein n=1 Tax=Massilia sp. METH4 TaxID=3123041 RepID=UPI0030CC1F60
MKALTLIASAVLALAGNAGAAEKIPTVGKLERVARFDGAMPTGVTVAENGRIFVNFPRWGDDVKFTVAELRNGKAVPYPQADADPFISVQSVVADGRGRVWILDTAAPEFSAPRQGGAKLVAVDLATNKIVKTVVFTPDAVLPTTYVNDVRFDFRVGAEGVAYITDSSLSGPGAIIVLDLASGKAVRRLEGHASVSPEPGFVPSVDGKPMPASFKVASDGIALSPDGETLYYCALSSRRLYAVPTKLLRDPSVSEADLAKAVRDLGIKGASDGLEADAKGAVYAGDYEHNAIRKLDAGATTWRTIAQAPRLSWPDTFSIGPDGYLYVIANQLHRQAGFNEGKDLRRKPYELLRVKVNAGPAPTK